MTPPDVVYAHPDGTTYVARFEDDDPFDPTLRSGEASQARSGQAWWRWPAEAHGWQQRVRCPEAMADACSELEPWLAALALRLSGVDDAR